MKYVVKPQMDTDGRRSQRGAALLLAMLFSVTLCVADVPPGWNTNLTAALKLAGSNNQPVLLYFTASWCGPCKLMQANTLPNPAVRDNLTNFAYVALDLEPNQETAQRHNVSSIPAFLILTPDGDEVLRTEGYQDSALFNAWLDKAKAAFTAEQEKLAAFRKTQEAIAVNLYSTDPAVRHAARSDLFNLCADREPSHQNYAATQLRTLAARDPKSLLPGLEHSRLATRIAVANQLRDKFGSNFTFDPWANPDEREKAVLALKNSTDLEKPQQIEAERKE